MNNRKIAKYAVLPVLGIGLLVGMNTASASGYGFGLRLSDEERVDRQTERRDERFALQAEILGVNEQVVRDAWEEGKTAHDLAEELGIDQATLQLKMRTARTEEMRERLATLVAEGKITNEQAEERIEFMENREPGNGVGQEQGFRGMQGRFQK